MWDITIAEVPLDLNAIYQQDRLFFVGVTALETGAAIYQLTNPNNLIRVLKASSALPLLYRGFPRIDEGATMDGGVADAIPVAAAIEQGAQRIMVFRSRHRDYVKKQNMLETAIVAISLRRHPQLVRTLATRAARYNAAVSLLRCPPAGVEIIEICPPDSFSGSRLRAKHTVLDEGYAAGMAAAANARRRWEAPPGD